MIDMMEKVRIGTLQTTHAKSKQNKVIINSKKNKYIVKN